MDPRLSCREWFLILMATVEAKFLVLAGSRMVSVPRLDDCHKNGLLQNDAFIEIGRAKAGEVWGETPMPGTALTFEVNSVTAFVFEDWGLTIIGSSERDCFIALFEILKYVSIEMRLQATVDLLPTPQATERLISRTRFNKLKSRILWMLVAAIVGAVVGLPIAIFL